MSSVADQYRPVVLLRRRGDGEIRQFRSVTLAAITISQDVDTAGDGKVDRQHAGAIEVQQRLEPFGMPARWLFST